MIVMMIEIKHQSHEKSSLLYTDMTSDLKTRLLMRPLRYTAEVEVEAGK